MTKSERACSSSEFNDANSREKLLALKYTWPVPRTDTRGQGEYPKVSELTVVKELCKITS